MSVSDLGRFPSRTATSATPESVEVASSRRPSMSRGCMAVGVGLTRNVIAGGSLLLSDRSPDVVELEIA